MTANGVDTDSVAMAVVSVCFAFIDVDALKSIAGKSGFTFTPIRSDGIVAGSVYIAWADAAKTFIHIYHSYDRSKKYSHQSEVINLKKETLNVRST